MILSTLKGLTMIKNRDLEEAFGFTLGQIKTWAVLVLGRDPRADQSGGVPRKYSLDDAFKIFMCGILVTRYRMELKKAQLHLHHVWPWLEKKGLLPSLLYPQWKQRIIFNPTRLTIHPGNSYHLQIFFGDIPMIAWIPNDSLESAGHKKEEKYTEWWFSPSGSPDITFEKVGHSYRIPISGCVEHFLDGLGEKGTLDDLGN